MSDAGMCVVTANPGATTNKAHLASQPSLAPRPSALHLRGREGSQRVRGNTMKLKRTTENKAEEPSTTRALLTS